MTATMDLPAGVKDRVARHLGSEVPGLQYVAVGPEGVRANYAGGWADIRARGAMTPATTLMAYSMTKTFTAIALLQLAEKNQLRLDDEMDRYLPDTPYRGNAISIRQLLAHTAGIPNPIPLRWVHLAAEAAGFDEAAALAEVLRKHGKLAAAPGSKYGYSNIGYWLLGQIIEQATGQSYCECVRAQILAPLGLAADEMDFSVPDPHRHAKGYLAKYSLMNLLKGLVTDRKFWGDYEGNWLHLRSHHLNGPAFGGLVGTARAFGRFLQDQLSTDSVLLSPESKRLLESQQATAAGRLVPMTLGWHIRGDGEATCLFKEGGGGGFHGEMRVYPHLGFGSVVMANATVFHSTRFLDEVDGAMR